MNPRDASLAEAALALGISVSTVRRNVREGAPCVSLGAAGRGKGSRVDIDKLRAWRGGGETPQQNDQQVLAAAAKGFYAAFGRDAPGHGRPAHAVLGLRDHGAAALYVHVFCCVAQQITGRLPDISECPREIADLSRIAETVRR